VCTIANFDIYISRAAKESNVVSITDIDLNVKSRGGKLFLICVVCVVCVAYVVCVGLKFFLYTKTVPPKLFTVLVQLAL
jgi:hypothetical protein